MANNNAPMGLRPINDNGTAWTGQGRLCRIPSSQAINIFLGDPLVPLGTTDAFGVPDVGIASAGATNTVLGSFLGVANGPARGATAASTVTRDSTVYHQSGVETYVLVADDPNQLYAIQEDSVGGAIADTTGGYANGNLVAGSGSTVTGFSGWMLDSSTVATGNPTYQLRVLGLLRAPDNAYGNYAKWVVRLNLPALWAATGY